MEQTRIWTFFYGSNINLDVLKKVNYIPRQVNVAMFTGSTYKSPLLPI